MIESIVRGGMAEVLKVYDAIHASHLAIKVLREDLGQDKIFLRRIQREAQALTRLQHRHIMCFLGMEQEDAMVFMLMDFLDGYVLREERVENRINSPVHSTYFH